MSVRPVRLNATIAWLFIVGAACFIVASVPAFATAAGGPVDSITYFVGSLFFTSASCCQLVQAQSPGTTGVDGAGQNTPTRLRFWHWQPRHRTWSAAAIQLPGTVFFNISTLAALTHNAGAEEVNRYVWRPDLYGSVLFLVSSALGVLAVSGHFWRVDTGSVPWRIAWLNMVGSILFMGSALASYVLPSTDEALSTRLAVGGTLLGAVCFLIGAALMFPAWRQAIGPKTPTHSDRYP